MAHNCATAVNSLYARGSRPGGIRVQGLQDADAAEVGGAMTIRPLALSLGPARSWFPRSGVLGIFSQSEELIVITECRSS